MGQYDLFVRILESLHEATLDDSHWPATSGLIDEACRVNGNMLVFGHGRSRKDTRVFLARFCFRGQRRQDLERDYFKIYYPRDERVPRLRCLADGRLVSSAQLFTDREKKSSFAYNEGLRRALAQDGLSVRLEGPAGSRIVWTFADPVETGGWRSAQIDMINRLLPHLRRYVHLRQVIFDAAASRASLAQLLDNTRCGVIQLDWRGRIVEANDLARKLLRRQDGLLDRAGYLYAQRRSENASLQRMLERALPTLGRRGVSGSATVGRMSVSPLLALHAVPVGQRETDFTAPRVAVLVLVVDPERKARIDPKVVASTLGLTPAESRVAGQLACGESIRDIALATGRKEGTIRWHVKRILLKLGISRQVELVRRVLSLAALRP